MLKMWFYLVMWIKRMIELKDDFFQTFYFCNLFRQILSQFKFLETFEDWDKQMAEKFDSFVFMPLLSSVQHFREYIIADLEGGGRYQWTYSRFLEIISIWRNNWNWAWWKLLKFINNFNLTVATLGNANGFLF